MNRLVFLDIDGVLNGHDWDEGAQSTRIQYRCIKQLNRIIKATGCKFVLSSAWRYMLLKIRSKRPAMTLTGFEYMMRTHGTCGFRLLGTTESDEAFGFPHDDSDDVRARQIVKWLKDNKFSGMCVVIDDDDFGFAKHRLPFVQTKSKWGLSRRDADKVIDILGSE